MSKIQKVIVAGAGGNLGPHILNALHNAGFSISVLRRESSNPPKTPLPANVTQITTDFSPESLLAAFTHQDAVVSCVGVEGVHHQSAMIDAAAEAGVKRFIPSEFGWSKNLPILPEIAARLKPKEEVFEKLVQNCQESKTMTWSAVATGPFLDWLSLIHCPFLSINVVPSLGFNLPNNTARIVDSGNEPITASTGSTIGIATAGMLLHPEETANRFLKVRSVVFTQNQCLEALEEVTSAKWDVTRVTVGELRESKAKKLAEKNFPGAFLDILSLQLFEDGTGRGMITPDKENDNEVLGVKEQSILQVLRSLVGEK